MTKLTVAFRNFAKPPKNKLSHLAQNDARNSVAMSLKTLSLRKEKGFEQVLYRKSNYAFHVYFSVLRFVRYRQLNKCGRYGHILKRLYRRVNLPKTPSYNKTKQCSGLLYTTLNLSARQDRNRPTFRCFCTTKQWRETGPLSDVSVLLNSGQKQTHFPMFLCY